MGKLFDSECTLACVRPTVTDNAGSSLFKFALGTVVDTPTANTAYFESDRKRLGATADQHSAAYTYLALAFRLIEVPSITVGAPGATMSSTQMFHFAGHAFREIGQLNRAADAYWRAGVTSKKDGNPDEFGIRSLARAKSCYAEIGEANRSDDMHFLEWEARRLRSRGLTPILAAWKVTSRYGTSARAWFVSVVIFLVGFGALYEALHACGWLKDTQPWIPVLTAVYYSVVTTATVGYGEIVPCHWVAQVVVTANILLAYVLLAIGATILGRKVLGR